MRVAIAGAGNVGLFIANDLRAAGHEVLLIEQLPAVVKRAQQPGDGIEWHIADCCEVNSLRAAGLDRATSWSPPPATTRTTSWSRCSPSRSSRCRASSPG